MEEKPLFQTLLRLFFIMTITFLLLIGVELIWGETQGKVKLLLLESLTLLPVLIYILIKRFSFRDVFRWHRVDGNILVVSGFIGLGLSFVTDELNRLIQMLIPMPEELFREIKQFLIFDSTGELFFIFVAVVVIASFTEEMLFRGFFQGSLERVTDATKAVMVTAFVFAFVHFNPWWFVEILILGVLLGVLVWRSGSVFPAVTVHAVYNTLAVVFVNTDEAKLGWYLTKGHVSPMWVVLGLGCIILGFRMFYRLTEEEDGVVE